MTEKIKNITLVVITAVFLFGFLLWGIIKPTDKESLSERRPLAEFPSLSADTVFSGSFMTDFEKYTLDQFPLRDSFRTVKAITAFYVFGQKDNNDIYIKDGFASKLDYPLNEESIDHAASRFNYVYERYLKDNCGKVYISVIPDKNFFMAEQNGYPSLDYDKLIADLRAETDFAEYINITHLLELSDYYCTDSHWRQEKITDVAKFLAEKMGVSLSGDFESNRVDAPFHGVYYGQSALPLPADELYYLEDDVLKNCKVYDLETDSYIPVYNLEKTEEKDPYEMYLSGSKSLLTLENTKADTDKELIIFRDSFGSSLAPLLLEGYAKITLVDIRYLSPELLSNFIDFNGQDVLFIYSTSVLNNSIMIK
ncbi:MAG: hypothetical protein J1E34_06690 [Oscillospiraceae bacterium]|nr:hypothetical protein [Oscillospiraceae bacterium]